jgi:ribosomal protein L37AE/L43A
VAWGVMCCGCCRLLAGDGTLIGEKRELDGFIDLKLLGRELAVGSNPADFGTHEAADAFAKEKGWTIVDPDGKSNHRCPECKIEPAKVKRRGAFIWLGAPQFAHVERTTPTSTVTPTEANGLESKP